eukprot:4482039-Pyramimonas_sp.AAC.1
MSNVDQSICLEDRGVVRACADDVGAALRRLEHLRIMRRIFSMANRVAALILKLKKCAVAPLSGPYTPALRPEYQAAIAQLVPDWTQIPVNDVPKYLGMWLGPAALDHSWRSPIAKWRSRTLELALTGAPPR